MGDKITQLPVATTVDGTEVVPIVQGGATKQVTGAILRRPVGAAGGDLTGTYPNPTLAAVTTAQSGVGSGAAIPVLTVDQKGRVTALTTVANPALTTNQIAGFTTVPAAALATTGVAGLSTFAARADHQHARPTPAEIGALGATAAAGGDLAGNFPNPVLASITTAQSNVGSLTAIPVISTDAKGRVTALSTIAFQPLTTTQIAGLATTPAAALATTGVAGLSTFAARADHQHARPTPAEIGALEATAAAGGDLVGNFPNPTLAAITTAQSNVGSGTSVPVLSIDAKGRVTALGSTPISGSAGGTVTSITAGTGLSGGTITSSGTIDIAAITTAQINVGSATQIPVLSINAQGQVTALSSVTASGGGAALSTTAPAALATAPYAGLSTEASRSDHQHLFPTAAQVGALGATAAAGGDLTGNYPNPTLNTVAVAKGGTGQTSFTDGQLLIGNSTGNTLSKATLTAGSGVTITNGAGSITIAATGAIYSAEIFLASGGGGGGSTATATRGSGGGAGGYIDSVVSFFSGNSYSIVIGAGGPGAASSAILPSDGNGAASSISGSGFTTVTAVGGGGGGQNGTDTSANQLGASGGSGGGGGTSATGSGTFAGGSATSGQGFAGGTGQHVSGLWATGGGGGGATAAGVSPVASTTVPSGGAGINWKSLGTTYCGGGGGAGTNAAAVGLGGAGGGGAGNRTGAGVAGTVNTGGGGGGGATGGSGGSGIVVIRYSGSPRGIGGTITSVGGYTYHTFTSSGTYAA